MYKIRTHDPGIVTQKEMLFLRGCFLKANKYDLFLSFFWGGVYQMFLLKLLRWNENGNKQDNC